MNSSYPTYKLGEICETTSGGTPNRKNDAYYGGSIPWVKSGELGKGVIYDTEEKITEEAVKESSAKIFPEGTLLIALYGATIGKLGFLGVPAATNQAVCGIFANEKIDLQFLSYYLFHKRNDLIAQGTGGAQPNISQTILKNLPIPLPPLPTQQAIVIRIELLFAELDKAVEKLKTAQQQLKVYKQAVLNGCLTKGSEKWEKVKLGEVAEMCLGKMLDKNKNKGNYQPYLRNVNVRWGSFDLDDLLEMRFEDSEQERYGLQNGDLIMCEGGEPGRCAIWKGEAQNMKIQKALHRIRLKPSVSNKYVYYLFCHYAQNGLLEKYFTGTTIKHLTGQSLKSIEIPLPSLPEQQRIVEEIETRLSACDEVEKQIAESLQQAEALRQSILKKAFSGELVVSIGSTTPNDA